MTDRMGCHDCAWWEQTHELPSTPTMAGVTIGRCRAAAPRTTPGGLTVWPQTTADDWCGQHPHLAAWGQRLTERAYLAQRGDQ